MRLYILGLSSGMCILYVLDSETPVSLVVPNQGPQIVPHLRLTVEVHHRIEHTRLEGLFSVLEQPHDGTPGDGSEYRKVA